MSEKEIKETTFKLNFFDEFPLDEFDKITNALKLLGYIGIITDNGNVIFKRIK